MVFFGGEVSFLNSRAVGFFSSLCGLHFLSLGGKWGLTRLSDIRRRMSRSEKKRGRGGEDIIDCVCPLLPSACA